MTMMLTMTPTIIATKLKMLPYRQELPMVAFMLLVPAPPERTP